MSAGEPVDPVNVGARSRIPAALFALAPGGSLGAMRKCLVEVKAANSCLVVPLEPNTCLIQAGEKRTLAEFDHVTIHRDLMVHIQGAGSNIPLTGPTIVDGALAHDAVHLVTLGTAPCGTTEPYSPRAQSHFEGGIPILPFAEDATWDPARTRLLVDIWASRPWFEATAFLPSTQSQRRYALSYNGCAAFGPVPSDWAFRDAQPPPCLFHFRFWYTELDFGVSGPVIIPGSQCLRIEQQSLQNDDA